MITCCAFLVLISRLAPLATCSVNDEQELLDYRDAMNKYLEYSDLVSAKSVSTKAKHWLSDRRTNVDVSARVLKIHQSMLLLDRLEAGQLCGLGGVEAVELLGLLTSLDHDSGDKYFDRKFNQLIDSIVRKHARECEAHNVALVTDAEAKLDGKDLGKIDRLASMVIRDIDERRWYHFAQQILCATETLTEFSCTLAADQVDDKDVAIVFTGQETSLTKKSLANVYERHIYKPCKSYVQAVEPVIGPIRADMFFFRFERGLLQARGPLARFLTCQRITGEDNWWHFKRFYDEVARKTGKKIKSCLIFGRPHAEFFKH